MTDDKILDDFWNLFSGTNGDIKNYAGEPFAFISGGKYLTSQNVLEIEYPYTGDVFASVCLASASDASDAVDSAVEGFSASKELEPYERRSILENLAGEIEKNIDLFTEILIKEGGKVRDLAKAEAERAVETIKISAEESVRAGGDIIPLDRTPQGKNHFGFTKRFPIGVVLAITPFNYPLNLACHKTGPAIAAGNSFILKPASKTPLSALLLGHLILKAGYPKKAVSVLPCSSDTAEKMAADDRIAHLSFTGSPDAGWHLKSAAGRKKVSLELGGTAAVIVHEDADIELAASGITRGALANAGQVCISVQRIFAHKNVYERLLDSLKQKFENILPDSPEKSGVILGPVVSSKAASDAMAKINEARDMGAEIICGGKSDKNLIYPTLIKNASPEMAVNSTEIFAPAATIAPYENIDEAIKYANNSLYGLQTAVFTKDIGNIMQAFKNIEAGGVIINDIPTFRVDVMPYGGIKMSGTGKEGPRYAIEEMTEEKLLVINNI